MAIYDDIRQCFEVNLSSTVGVPDIAWENVSFSPSTDSSYVRVSMVPTRREPAVRGVNPQMYYQGYFLVDCCVPEGVGPAVADDLADLIMSTFDATVDISNAGTTLQIRYSERDLGIKEGSHYCVPVRIGFYLYNAN